MKVEHKMKWGWIGLKWVRLDGCVGLNWTKEREVQNSQNCYDWKQSVWWSRRVDWDVERKDDTDWVKCLQHYKLKELDRRDVQRRYQWQLYTIHNQKKPAFNINICQYWSKWCQDYVFVLYSFLELFVLSFGRTVNVTIHCGTNSTKRLFGMYSGCTYQMGIWHCLYYSYVTHTHQYWGLSLKWNPCCRLNRVQSVMTSSNSAFSFYTQLISEKQLTHAWTPVRTQ